MFSKKKTKEMREPFNLKKELKLLPGYIVLVLWVLLTVVMLVWILAASFSTTKDIFSGNVFSFSKGLQFKNYIDAWQSQNISVFFLNSLSYAVISVIFIQLISAPAAYVLSRFTFLGNKTFKTSLVLAMSIPVIMIIMPLFSLTSKLNVSGRVILIILYICMNIPFTTTFLMNFFKTLSRSYEEAAAMDGCSPVKTFWKIMLPLAQPGIITVSIFNFLAVWNEYFMSLIFASSDNVKSVGVGLVNLMDGMKYSGNYGGMYAAVIIVFLPTFIIYVFLSDKIIAGVTGGGVKG